MRGEALGVIRPAASLLSSPRAAPGPAPLAWHPLTLLLAAGGAEPAVSLFGIQPTPAPPPVSMPSTPAP